MEQLAKDVVRLVRVWEEVIAIITTLRRRFARLPGAELEGSEFRMSCSLAANS